MALTDQEFREEFKPIQIPEAYHVDDTQENKVIFALADLGEGSAAQVVEHLEKLEPGIKSEELSAFTEKVLADHYNKGLLKGSEEDGVMNYNLSKITRPNDGAVDPDLLAPGLD